MCTKIGSSNYEEHLYLFNVYGSVHRKNIPIYIQQDATLHSLFISANCSTRFGYYLHPQYVEQFPDKINCVTLHLVGYILEYLYLYPLLFGCTEENYPRMIFCSRNAHKVL